MKYTFHVHFKIKKETGEQLHKSFSFKAGSFYEAAQKGIEIAKKHGDTFFIKKLTRIS